MEYQLSRPPRSASIIAKSMCQSDIGWFMGSTKRERDQVIHRGQLDGNTFATEMAHAPITLVYKLRIDSRNKGRTELSAALVTVLSAHFGMLAMPVSNPLVFRAVIGWHQNTALSTSQARNTAMPLRAA